MNSHTEDDLYYINHYLIWLDIEICIKMMWIIIRGKGTYYDIQRNIKKSISW